MKKHVLPLTVFYLLSGTNLFAAAETCPSPAPWNPNPVPSSAGYGAPARIETTDWNAYFTANFIYWCPSQENMELGIVNATTSATYPTNGDVLKQGFDYAPGFQVGVGGNLNRDNWDLYAEYTWLRNTDRVSVTLNPATQELIPLWSKPDPAGATFLQGSEAWRLSMDLADLELGRSYYLGTALTVRPFTGARVAFIRQYLDVDYLNETTGFLGHRNTFVNQKIQSWGAGPLAGFYGNWMATKHFRVYGNGSADILFTQYRHLGYKQFSTTAAGAFAANSGILVRETNLNYLRTHLALEIGLGWGDYFRNGAYHADFSASYGFQVFFNQNMFRGFADDQAFNSTAPHGDLFIHGLTVTTRFDF